MHMHFLVATWNVIPPLSEKPQAELAQFAHTNIQTWTHTHFFSFSHTVHGFNATTYEVEEGQRLTTELVLNVKGRSRVFEAGYVFQGSILTQASGTTSNTN